MIEQLLPLASNNSSKTCSEANVDELFPFEYVGTGYFRLKGVPKGVNATDYATKHGDGVGILHGMQAIEYLYKRMLECSISMKVNSDSSMESPL